jgi:2-methylcitrate dehydratase PrpD
MNHVDQGNVTRRLAEYVANAELDDFPNEVTREARRALTNIVGCTVGGCRHESVLILRDALSDFFGPPQACLVGLGRKADILHASYVNCLSSSVNSFDEGHAETIVHPSGPVASALFALSELRSLTGGVFLTAFILGVETICRLSKVIAFPPERGNIGWVQTGVTAGMGVAAAVSNAIGLDAERTLWAIGIASSQAAGFRGNHGSMCTGLIAAHTAMSGLAAALLAERGFTSSPAPVETKHGFAAAFSHDPDIGALVRGLGDSFDLLGLIYKPYPAAVVVNPVIDACLALHGPVRSEGADIRTITLRVNPTAAAIADRKHPADSLAAQLSLQHWAAAAIAFGDTGTEALTLPRLRDPRIANLREKVALSPSADFAPDAARVTLLLADGTTLDSDVEHCIGSASRPLTDDQIEEKFRRQVEAVFSTATSNEVLAVCRNIESVSDVGTIPAMIAVAEC